VEESALSHLREYCMRMKSPDLLGRAVQCPRIGDDRWVPQQQGTERTSEVATFNINNINTSGLITSWVVSQS